MIQKNITNFTKTKILCTLGPVTSSKEIIKKLIEEGMDGVRLNFSHSDHNFFDKLFNEINLACIEENLPLPILVDLQGPKIRIGNLVSDEIEIKTNDKIEITIDDVIGTKDLISTSYKLLIKDANIGDVILIDDGLIRLRIVGKREKSVICNIENGGILKPKKGMNLPEMKLSTPSFTEKDLKDLEFCFNYRIDFIALSFVRKADDIIHLRNWLNEKGKNIPIIAKIEKKEAVEDFENILKVADGIMIARGDLGVEMNSEDVPIIQKQIIQRCNAIGKLVITATQMLESMIKNPIPTRAEASDVANAVWDGTDVVMLSGETSVGEHPIDVVRIMNNIIHKAESNFNNRKISFDISNSIEEKLFDSLNEAICLMSEHINASAIVVFTTKGRAAKSLSKYRPHSKIIAISNSFETMNNLCLKWGVIPIYSPVIDKEHIAIENAKKLIMDSGIVNQGEIVIFTTSAPISEKSRVNWLRLEVM